MRASSSAPIHKRPIRKRRVFYIPGYDPIHPRRYRELYRKEGADQAKISGYEIDLKPNRAKGAYGWHVEAQIDGQQVESDFAVLVWSDIVKQSMGQSIPATYLQLARTAYAYIGSGALFRLMRLRKGPTIAALYPVVFLLGQLALALIAGGCQERRPDDVAVVVSTIGAVPISMTFCKSFCVSNGRFGISAGFTACVSNTITKV